MIFVQKKTRTPSLTESSRKIVLSDYSSIILRFAHYCKVYFVTGTHLLKFANSSGLYAIDTIVRDVP